MKKLSFLLLSIAFAIFIFDGQALAVPDIRGEYSGTYSIVVSNCTNSSSNGTYNAVLEMNISNQYGNTFSGTATGTFEPGAVEYIQLSGTITESGQLSGNTTHTFLNTAGEGTFTGQFCVGSLSIENTGHDTSGDTCEYTRYISANRPSSFSYSEFKLNSPSVNPDSLFGYGYSVSISGDYAIVPDMNDDDVATNSGAAYIFRKNGTTWTQEAKLTASDGANYDRFGRSVAISDDYAIVGVPTDTIAPSVHCGSAYIFEKNGTDWLQTAKVTGSNESAAGNFGADVALSGEYVIIGVPGDDEIAIDSGSAYIFRKSSNGWIQDAKLTASNRFANQRFGNRVSISDDFAIVGPGQGGAAYIYKRDSTGWIEETKLSASDGVNEFTVMDVSISGSYAIIGGPSGANSSVALVFKREDTGWLQETKLTASDGETEPENSFGVSVSISDQYAIVGCPADDDNGAYSGSVYIYQRCGSRWFQISKITAGDGKPGDWFGHSVSISDRYGIVGGQGDAAYIFDLTNTNPINYFLMPSLQLLLSD